MVKWINLKKKYQKKQIFFLWYKLYQLKSKQISSINILKTQLKNKKQIFYTFFFFFFFFFFEEKKGNN